MCATSDKCNDMVDRRGGGALYFTESRSDRYLFGIETLSV